jgi:hypothetical protein
VQRCTRAESPPPPPPAPHRRRYGIDDETAEEIACVTFQQVVRDLMVCAVQPLHPLEVTVLTTWERSTGEDAAALGLAGCGLAAAVDDDAARCGQPGRSAARHAHFTAPVSAAGGTGYMTLNAEDDTGGISHNTGAVSSEEDDGAAPQAGAQDAKSHMLDNEAAKSPSRAQRMLHQAASEHALRSAGLASFGGKRVAEQARPLPPRARPHPRQHAVQLGRVARLLASWQLGRGQMAATLSRTQVSAAQPAGEESHRETLRKGEGAHEADVTPANPAASMHCLALLRHGVRRLPTCVPCLHMRTCRAAQERSFSERGAAALVTQAPRAPAHRLRW